MNSLREDFIVYLNGDLPRFKHALKTAFAVVVSMLICMRLELRAPGTAMVSAGIVMIHQQSGMVIARSFYRAIGIGCGSLAGLTLICLAVQWPLLYLGGLAIWIGIFVTGASYYRNFQSYAFVLSGYSASITTVPILFNPYDVFTNVVYTVSEVAIGVTISSLVSAVVFPERVAPALVVWRQKALTKLFPLICAAVRGELVSEPTGKYIDLVKESVTVEALHTAAVFEEPEMRLRQQALLRLNETFLDVVTRIHAIYRVRQLSSEADLASREKIEGMFQRLGEIISDPELTGSRPARKLSRLSSRLRRLEREFPALIGAERRTVDASGQEQAPVTERVGLEIYSVATSLRRFCSACRMAMRHSGRVPFTPSIPKAITFFRTVHLRSSGTIALLAGIRAAVAVGVVGAAWIATGWTNGSLALVSVAISTGLYSLMASPTSASWQAFVGCLAAWIAAFTLNFFLYPVSDDVLLLSVGIATCVFFASYVGTFPKYPVLGAAFNLYLALILAPTNPATFNPPLLLDHGFALLCGIAIAAVAFSLIAPREGEWLARHYGRQIRSLVVLAATGRVESDSVALIGASLRDMIVQLSIVRNVSDKVRLDAIDWAFGALWIADTVVQVRLRSSLDRHLLPPQWEAALPQWLAAVASMAGEGSPAAAQAAVVSTEAALRALGRGGDGDGDASEAGRAIFEMRARLQSTSFALTDLRELLSRRETV